MVGCRTGGLGVEIVAVVIGHLLAHRPDLLKWIDTLVTMIACQIVTIGFARIDYGAAFLTAT
jgi:hypothetical protein